MANRTENTIEIRSLNSQPTGFDAKMVMIRIDGMRTSEWLEHRELNRRKHDWIKWTILSTQSIPFTSIRIMSR